MASWTDSSDDEEFLGFTDADILGVPGDLDSDFSLPDSESDDEGLPLSSFRGQNAKQAAGDPSSETATTTPPCAIEASRWGTTLEKITVGEFRQQTGSVNTLDTGSNELDFLNLLFPDEL